MDILDVLKEERESVEKGNWEEKAMQTFDFTQGMSSVDVSWQWLRLDLREAVDAMLEAKTVKKKAEARESVKAVSEKMNEHWFSSQEAKDDYTLHRTEDECGIDLWTLENKILYTRINMKTGRAYLCIETQDSGQVVRTCIDITDWPGHEKRHKNTLGDWIDSAQTMALGFGKCENDNKEAGDEK